MTEGCTVSNHWQPVHCGMNLCSLSNWLSRLCGGFFVTYNVLTGAPAVAIHTDRVWDSPLEMMFACHEVGIWLTLVFIMTLNTVLSILCSTVNADEPFVYTTNIIHFQWFISSGGGKDKSLSRKLYFFPFLSVKYRDVQDRDQGAGRLRHQELQHGAGLGLHPADGESRAAGS